MGPNVAPYRPENYVRSVFEGLAIAIASGLIVAAIGAIASEFIFGMNPVRGAILSGAVGFMTVPIFIFFGKIIDSVSQATKAKFNENREKVLIGLFVAIAFSASVVIACLAGPEIGLKMPSFENAFILEGTVFGMATASAILLGVPLLLKKQCELNELRKNQRQEAK